MMGRLGLRICESKFSLLTNFGKATSCQMRFEVVVNYYFYNAKINLPLIFLLGISSFQLC